MSDNDPFWGSAADPTTGNRQPINPTDTPTRYQLNQTYASLPLTFNGEDIRKVTGFDKMSAADLGDVRDDIPAIAAMKSKSVPWGWFQEGYDREPTDVAGAPLHSSYIGHHNGPQYFGYVSDNAARDDAPLWTERFLLARGSRRVAFKRRRLLISVEAIKISPASNPPIPISGRADELRRRRRPSGLFGRAHQRGARRARSQRDREEPLLEPERDRHITYDESEGDYDHVPPVIQEYSPAGLPLVHGPRIPFIVISPFANAHAVSHESGDHNSLIRFIDELYGLPFLADLPDEAKARKAGRARFGQPNLGPDDDGNPFNGDLLSAFDFGRLSNEISPLPRSYAYIPDAIAQTIPPAARPRMRRPPESCPTMRDEACTTRFRATSIRARARIRRSSPRPRRSATSPVGVGGPRVPGPKGPAFSGHNFPPWLHRQSAMRSSCDSKCPHRRGRSGPWRRRSATLVGSSRPWTCGLSVRRP